VSGLALKLTQKETTLDNKNNDEKKTVAKDGCQENSSHAVLERKTTSALQETDQGLSAWRRDRRRK